MVGTRRRVQVHVRISGNVQTTGMRSMMQREAKKSGVTGWVRNAEDEDGIEAIFNGTQGAIIAMVRWCERGPLSELVTAVDVESMPREAFHGFDVRH